MSDNPDTKAVLEREAVGNAEAMREALVGLAQAVQDFMATKGRNFYPDMAVALEAAAAALSAPPRNCDIGSPEEQTQRMEKFCKSHGHGFDGQKCYSCENCKLISVDRCELAWAQMPYEANEKGEVDDSNG